jgi:amidohydrolase
VSLNAEFRRFVEAVDESLTSQLSGAVTLRQRLHQAPEVSWQEHQTSATIGEALRGFTLEPIAETGLLVRVGDANLPAIGIRAELDGLPIEEQTRASFASSNGAMHACGHDVHMSALVALLHAFASANQSERTPFSLLGVFQPSEESFPSGAKKIIETGRLDEHHLRAMLAVHLHPQAPWGAITTGTGAVNACADSFVLTVTGVGGHGAYPHRGHDPVLALSQIIVALQQIVSRRTDPMHPTVVSVGRLQAGSAANVIPDEAVAEGTVRVLVPDDRDEVLALLESISEHTAAAFGCDARVEISPGDPVLINDAQLVAKVDPCLESAGFTVAEPMRSCGADDFAFYGHEVPSLMMFLGVQGRSDGDSDSSPREQNSGLHSSMFLPPEDAVERTARAMLAAFTGAAELVVERSSAS